MTRRVGADQNLDWRCAMISALDWWHDAGVDTLVDDRPRDWLAPPVTMPQGAPASVAATALPPTLTGFLEWRGGTDAPEAGWSGSPVRASGPATAAVMVLVNCPHADDATSGLMTGGDTGRLFARILAAVGLSRDAIHIAALCLKRPPAGRIPREAEARLTELALHHIALVAPRRLLLLGDATSCAVLGANVAAVRGGLRPLNHDGVTTEVVATFHPELLLKRPECKAAAWKDLRMLVEGLR
jgi:DNA polymerase